MHVQFMGGEMHSRIFTLMGLCLDGYAVRLAARPGCAIMHLHLHTTGSGGGMSALAASHIVQVCSAWFI